MGRFRCIHVLRQANPHLPEVLSSYRDAASRSDGKMLVYSAEQWSSRRPEWQDPETAIILWWSNNAFVFEQLVPSERKAALVLWYLESPGPLEGLCGNQKRILTGFMKFLKIPDLVLSWTPSGAEALRPYCRRTAYAPIGYDPRFMGAPDWSAPKRYDFGCCAPLAGRRGRIVPALRSHFRERLFYPEQIWKADLRRVYNQCRAILYIAHSDEPSFPGLRLWEAAATSAALVTEKRDAWPAVAGRHYVEIPEAKEDLEGFIGRVESTLDLPLEAIARTAHAELSEYTPERATQYIMEAL